MSNRAPWGTEGLYPQIRKIRLQHPNLGMYGVIAKLGVQPSAEEREAIYLQFFQEKVQS